jgi:hypothetical protein
MLIVKGSTYYPNHLINQEMENMNKIISNVNLKKLVKPMTNMLGFAFGNTLCKGTKPRSSLYQLYPWINTSGCT